MNAAILERRPATEEISDVIERVTFHNDDSGLCVLRVKVRRQREDGRRVADLRDRRGMAECGGLVGQEQGAWAAIQGDEHEDRAADHSRGHRAVARQRLGERDRTDSREEAGWAVRSRGSNRDREPSRRTPIGGRDRSQAPGRKSARSCCPCTATA
jgi:hypothetical protein